MAKLSVMEKDTVIRVLEISEGLVTLGREATNEVPIADPSVSRQHAWVEKREDGYYLVDKNSSNGTFINGKKISQQKLNHKDKINLGNASVLFEDEEQVSATFVIATLEGAKESEELKKPEKNEEIATGALPFSVPQTIPPSPPERPVPPPPPLAQQKTPQANYAPPPPVTPAPKVEPTPAAPVSTLCTSCKKPVEPGARFCGFCGTPVGGPKPAVASPGLNVPKPATPAPPAAAPKPVSTPSAPLKPASVSPSVPASSAAPTGLVYAGFGVRLVAYLLDALILFVLLLIPIGVVVFVYWLPMRTGQEPGALQLIVTILCQLIIFAVAVGYQLYFIGVKGATPGKRMMKLKVALVDGAYPIGYGKAVLRMIGYMVSAMLCYVGFIMIALDKVQHRGLHDKIAGTIVIKEN